MTPPSSAGPQAPEGGGWAQDPRPLTDAGWWAQVPKCLPPGVGFGHPPRGMFVVRSTFTIFLKSFHVVFRVLTYFLSGLCHELSLGAVGAWPTCSWVTLGKGRHGVGTEPAALRGPGSSVGHVDGRVPASVEPL